MSDPRIVGVQLCLRYLSIWRLIIQFLGTSLRWEQIKITSISVAKILVGVNCWKHAIHDAQSPQLLVGTSTHLSDVCIDVKCWCVVVVCQILHDGGEVPLILAGDYLVVVARIDRVLEFDRHGKMVCRAIHAPELLYKLGYPRQALFLPCWLRRGTQVWFQECLNPISHTLQEIKSFGCIVQWSSSLACRMAISLSFVEESSIWISHECVKIGK